MYYKLMYFKNENRQWGNVMKHSTYVFVLWVRFFPRKCLGWAQKMPGRRLRLVLCTPAGLLGGQRVDLIQRPGRGPYLAVVEAILVMYTIMGILRLVVELQSSGAIPFAPLPPRILSWLFLSHLQGSKKRALNGARVFVADCRWGSVCCYNPSSNKFAPA